MVCNQCRRPIIASLYAGLPRVVQSADYATIQTQQKQICELLYTLFPTAHILIVTRNWHSILHSSYSQHVRSGGTQSMATLFSGDTALLSDVFDYDYLIDLYEARFGREQVLVLPYELLKAGEQGFQQAIETALHIPHVPIVVGKVNQGLSDPEKYWYPIFSRLLSRLPQRVFRLYVGLLFRRKPQRLAQLLTRMTGRNYAAPDISALASQIAKHPLRFVDRPIFQPYLDQYNLPQ